MAASFGISQVLRNHPFRAINPALRKPPLDCREFNLCGFGFLKLAANGKFV